MCVGRDGLGSANCAVPVAACDDALSARTIPGIKRGVAVAGWPAVSSGDSGGGGGDGDGLGLNSMGGPACVEVAGSRWGVVGEIDSWTDVAEEGCIGS